MLCVFYIISPCMHTAVDVVAVAVDVDVAALRLLLLLLLLSMVVWLLPNCSCVAIVADAAAADVCV